MRRPTKITFAEMREQGVRGILICCAGLPIARIRRRSAPTDGLMVSGCPDIEDRFTCTVCGKRGADGAARFQLE
jgi:hypothetical protein